MFDTYIKIYQQTEERDALNKRKRKDEFVTESWAQRTERGGRENLYASRIVNEGEVVYTVRWNECFKAGQYVVEGERRSRVLFVVQEGRRKYMHLKCKLTNADS